ncbi:unnamed protein product, partial [Didymodactylos carnosus]
FNSYLLYLQTSYLIRPDEITQNELNDGLIQCGASVSLLTNCNRIEPIDSISYPERYCLTILSIKENYLKLIRVLLAILFLLEIWGLSLDLYRQIILWYNLKVVSYSNFIIVFIYIIDSGLFCLTAIELYIQWKNCKHWRLLLKNPCLAADILSCLGTFIYFVDQRPITTIYRQNILWSIIHLCRSLRLAQFGFRLIDIQWCLYAIALAVKSFFLTTIAMIWLFTLSGT